MGSPIGQPVMVSTPRQPHKHNGLGGSIIIQAKPRSCFSGARKSPNCYRLCSINIPIRRFMWRGTTPVPMRMTRGIALFGPPVDNWFCSIYLPMRFGSIQLKCSSGIFGVKSPTANYLRRSKPYFKRHRIY